jgi:hypothetical protein
MLPLLLLSAATFLPLSAQPLLAPRLFVCAFSRLFAFCALDVRFLLPIPVASSLLTSDTHPSFHSPVAAQTAPQESEFRSIMGLFTTTGKVFPANHCFRALFCRRIQSAHPLLYQGKAAAGQRPVECFMCSVTKKTGGWRARLLSSHRACIAPYSLTRLQVTRKLLSGSRRICRDLTPLAAPSLFSRINYYRLHRLRAFLLEF